MTNEERAKQAAKDFRRGDDLRKTILSTLDAATKEKDKALFKAATTFRHYENLHKAKGTDEGNRKASENARLAEVCEAALEKKGDEMRDEQCEVCGIGFRLPSGVCDHCDQPFKGSRIDVLQQRIAELEAKLREGKVIFREFDDTVSKELQILKHRAETAEAELVKARELLRRVSPATLERGFRSKSLMNLCTEIGAFLASTKTP